MNILLIFPGFIVAFIIILCYERKIRRTRNKVHFYIARDMDDSLYLYLGKPFRYNTEFRSNIGKGVMTLICDNFKRFGLNEDDYANLKWEDEPLEVFVNMED